jgi:SAM domain (Sterile alpha motif)
VTAAGEESVDIGMAPRGLKQYEQALCDNAIDAAVLPELTADDLKDLGVAVVEHRRKLLTVIAALRSDGGPAPETSALAPPPNHSRK